MLFLAFPFFHSLLLCPTLVPEMLFLAFLFLAFLVAISNTTLALIASLAYIKKAVIIGNQDNYVFLETLIKYLYNEITSKALFITTIKQPKVYFATTRSSIALV